MTSYSFRENKKQSSRPECWWDIQCIINVKCTLLGKNMVTRFQIFSIFLLDYSNKSYINIATPLLILYRRRPSRSSRLEAFCKEGVLTNFAKFTGKHLCQSLFFNKVAALRPATLLKKRLWHRCFPVNFAKFLRTPFLTEHPGWLLLSFWGVL